MIQSKIAFISELPFDARIPLDYPNMRTEFAWMHALGADHFNIRKFQSNEQFTEYDHVFIIFPKGKTFLNSEGSKLVNGINPISELLHQNIVERIKEKGNLKVHYIQEGPHWWFNDYEIDDQIHFYNFLSNCDSIFTHNDSDVYYYKGLFPDKEVRPIGTLMIDTLINDIVPTKEDKAIIGGKFARWYGGFESYIIADNFNVPIWAQTSHAMRADEASIAYNFKNGLQHLPRVSWIDWMVQLSTFKYGVHMMPTVAAGTFALNCAYFGIPCIGNADVDTQLLCHPLLSVAVNDLETARVLANELKNNEQFYKECSEMAKVNYEACFSQKVWTDRIKRELEL
jgi:hypothetical protein